MYMHISIELTLTQTRSTSSINLCAYSCVAIKICRKKFYQDMMAYLSKQSTCLKTETLPEMAGACSDLCASSFTPVLHPPPGLPLG